MSNKFGCNNYKQGQLNHPSGVAVDSSGNIYVADTNNDRIAVFDSSGKLLKSIGSKGSRPGEFNHPSGVAVDSICNIYVADTNNDRMQRITQCGVQHPPVVFSESVGLQDVVITSFSGTGVGKNLSVELAESVGRSE